MEVAGGFFLPVNRFSVQCYKKLFPVEQPVLLVGIDKDIVTEPVAHNGDIILYIEEIILHITGQPCASMPESLSTASWGETVTTFESWFSV